MGVKSTTMIYCGAPFGLDIISGNVINIPAVQAGTPMIVKCLERGWIGLPPFLTLSKIN